MTRQPNRAARPTIDHLITWLKPLGNDLCKTLTFDNGTEFAEHHQLNKLGVKTFFCDAHSPWQKGGIENAIGRMRRPLPRSTEIATLDPKTLTAYVAAYNNTPRKCLGFKTPAQAFLSQVLHFKCESAYRLSPARRGSAVQSVSIIQVWYYSAAIAIAISSRRPSARSARSTESI